MMVSTRADFSAGRAILFRNPTLIESFRNCMERSRPTMEPGPLLTIRNLTRDTLLGDAVELADRGATRRKGLLGRDGLCKGGGLWIVPCESVHTFGMRFAIDLVYLNRRRRVKKVRHAVPPWRMSACLTAQSVLELPPGTIARSRTQKGDQIEIRFPD